VCVCVCVCVCVYIYIYIYIYIFNLQKGQVIFSCPKHPSCLYPSCYENGNTEPLSRNRAAGTWS